MPTNFNGKWLKAKELMAHQRNAIMQYETCRHIKEDGAYCGSPRLRDQKYCYYHLMQRVRRLRRARALRDNVPYRLEIQSLDNVYAVRNALTEIAQALAAGQLDARTAGKLLYAIQQVSATNRRIEQMEAAQLEKLNEEKDGVGVPHVRAPHLGANMGSDDDSRIREFPDFEKQFGLAPGADLDAETDAVLRKADEEAHDRRAESMPEPPPGVRLGSAAYRVYREEAYQVMRLQLLDLRAELRKYRAKESQQVEAIKEAMKKEAVSAAPLSERRADSA
jgi:hypothetical protein